MQLVWPREGGLIGFVALSTSSSDLQTFRLGLDGQMDRWPAVQCSVEITKQKTCVTDDDADKDETKGQSY